MAKAWITFIISELVTIYFCFSFFSALKRKWNYLDCNVCNAESNFNFSKTYPRFSRLCWHSAFLTPSSSRYQIIKPIWFVLKDILYRDLLTSNFIPFSSKRLTLQHAWFPKALKELKSIRSKIISIKILKSIRF